MRGFPRGTVVKNLPAMQETQETQVRFLGWEDPLGIGNGTLLQYSYLKNSKDRGARLATVHGVTKRRTQLSTHCVVNCARISAWAFMGFPSSSAAEEADWNAGDPSLIPGLGKYTGKGIVYPLQFSWVSLVTQLVKNLPAMRETRVQSLD